jgi:hypothetical protein
MLAKNSVVRSFPNKLIDRWHFPKIKAARHHIPGDKKTAQGRVHLPRAPDTESKQYRNGAGGSKENFRLSALEFDATHAPNSGANQFADEIDGVRDLASATFIKPNSVSHRPQLRDKCDNKMDGGIARNLHHVNEGDAEDVSEVHGVQEEEKKYRSF